MSTRREFLSSIPAIWLTSPVMADARIDAERETLQEILDKLRDRVTEDMPDLSKLQITYDPGNKKVPLMVLALRV